MNKHDKILETTWPLKTLRRFSPFQIDSNAKQIESIRHPTQRCPRCFLRMMNSVAYETSPGNGQNTLECQVCGLAKLVGGWSISSTSGGGFVEGPLV